VIVRIDPVNPDHHAASVRRGDTPLLLIASAADGPRIALEMGADAYLPIGTAPNDLVAVVGRLTGGQVRPSGFLLIRGERRSPTRPSIGDVKPCPKCQQAMRFAMTSPTAPAWVCRNDACGNREFVRREGAHGR
jgi:hypothetical protein